MNFISRSIIFTLAISTFLGRVEHSFEIEDFHAITDCTCPEDVVTYECTVCGENDTITVWEESALQCPTGEITLTNRNFETTGAFRACNNGRIVAHGLSVENGCYTSQLNITFDAGLQGSSIACSVDNGTHSREIGCDTILTTTRSFPPPQGIRLTRVNSSELTFAWDQTNNTCPSISYKVLSNNCGNCLNTTNDTVVSCFNFTILGSAIMLCSLAVEVIVCSNSDSPIIGNPSSPVIVNLTVPTITNVTTIPHYYIDNGLWRLTVNFSTVNSFIIYDGINGSATSYTITYSDSMTGGICRSDTIPASNCTNGTCSHLFDTSSSLCRSSSDINVTIFTTTNLGNGLQSEPVKEEHLNNFVRVQITAESTSINCTFLAMPNERTSCNATITYGDNCQEKSEIIEGISETDAVVSIKLGSFLEDTMPSRYCTFVVTAAAGTRLVYVEGTLTVIPFNTGPNIVIIATIVVFVVILIVFIATIVLIIIYVNNKRSRRHNEMYYTVSTTFIPLIYSVENEINMIEFAKHNIPNYDPDRGKGYYQLIDGSPEYISSQTDVILISEDRQHVCTGSEARKVIGFSDEQTPIELPDLSDTEWKYAYIQSNSRLRVLPQGTSFLFNGKKDEFANQQSPRIAKNKILDLKEVDKEHYKLYTVTKKCQISDFMSTQDHSNPDFTYIPGWGYGFYEFTKPELISHDKQVILMDRGENLYYGPDARHEIIDQVYDESKEIDPPNFEGKEWKCAFVQTRSNARELQPNTRFLYCTIGSTEMVKVTSPFKILYVDEQDEDKRKMIKYATEHVPYYNPRAGYGYYEFTVKGYVLPERNVIAKNKDGELFTGPGVRKLIGAEGDYDSTSELSPPRFNDENNWDCIFIQGRAYGRKLVNNTRFLYCEYDYNPEIH